VNERRSEQKKNYFQKKIKIKIEAGTNQSLFVVPARRRRFSTCFLFWF
jgi:hypothetical protein